MTDKNSISQGWKIITDAVYGVLEMCQVRTEHFNISAVHLSVCKNKQKSQYSNAFTMKSILACHAKVIGFSSFTGVGKQYNFSQTRLVNESP